MGEPIKIVDLAKRMIHLSGLEVKDKHHPNGEIEISFTGLRPGEKLYEELLIGDNVSDTAHCRIMRAEEDVITWDGLCVRLDRLKAAVEDDDCLEMRVILMESVAGFVPQCEVSDWLWKAGQGLGTCMKQSPDF